MASIQRANVRFVVALTFAMVLCCIAEAEVTAARALVEEFGTQSLTALTERLTSAGASGCVDAASVPSWRAQFDSLKAVVRGAGFALSEAGAGKLGMCRGWRLYFLLMWQQCAQKGLALPQAWNAGNVSPLERSRRSDSRATACFYCTHIIIACVHPLSTTWESLFLLPVFAACCNALFWSVL